MVKEQVIQTPTRRIPVIEIKPGTPICDTEGGIQKVIAVHRKDDALFYRMTFSDDTEGVCCAEHIWLAWRSHVGRRKRSLENPEGYVTGEAAARKYLTCDLIAGMKQGKRYRIPLCKPASG